MEGKFRGVNKKGYESVKLVLFISGTPSRAMISLFLCLLLLLKFTWNNLSDVFMFKPNGNYASLQDIY